MTPTPPSKPNREKTTMEKLADGESYECTTPNCEMCEADRVMDAGMKQYRDAHPPRTEAELNCWEKILYPAVKKMCDEEGVLVRTEAEAGDVMKYRDLYENLHKNYQHLAANFYKGIEDAKWGARLEERANAEELIAEAVKALESQVAARDSLLERAKETIHDEFCGGTCHPLCIISDLSALKGG